MGLRSGPWGGPSITFSLPVDCLCHRYKKNLCFNGWFNKIKWNLSRMWSVPRLWPPVHDCTLGQQLTLKCVESKLHLFTSPVNAMVLVHIKGSTVENASFEWISARREKFYFETLIAELVLLWKRAGWYQDNKVRTEDKVTASAEPPIFHVSDIEIWWNVAVLL